MSESLNSQIEKLENVSLENVSGCIYVDWEEVASGYMLTATPIGVVGALGCSIAGFVCQNKASKYMQQGDKTKSEKYSKAAKGLGIASISCAGLATAGAACMWASKLHIRQHGKNAIL